MYFRYIGSPLGELLLAGDETGLRFLSFPAGKGKLEPGPDWLAQPDCFSAVEVQLAEYFNGSRIWFDLQLTRMLHQLHESSRRDRAEMACS